MKINFLHIILALLAASMIYSCAERIDAETVGKDEKLTLDSWIKFNVPEAVMLDEGIYYEWLNHPQDGKTPITEVEGLWVKVNYTGYSFINYDVERRLGNIFMTREEAIARRAGSYNVYTQYVPQLVQYGDSASGLMAGMNRALKEMRIGDKIRLYLSSTMASSSISGVSLNMTYDYGYGGNASIAFGYPMIVEMELAGSMLNPADVELSQVRNYATDKMGLGLYDALDSDEDNEEGTHLSIYMKITDPGETPDVRVSPDSTLRLHYTGYFIDNDDKGFVFDTNDTIVGLELGRDTTGYSRGLQFRASSTGSNYIAAFTKMIEAKDKSDTTKYMLSYGSSFTMVLTSDWGYGPQGYTGGSKSTYVQPYSPMIFDIRIAPYEAEEEEEE